jgi:AraC-like DNA-binding protein/quercetin dioxygenase-like cupin family protein
MSFMRQAFSTAYDPKRGVAISTLAYDYPRGYNVPEHGHGAHQVIYATQGVMEVTVGQSLWLIPPQFAIWIPARTRHSIRMPARVSMRTLYLHPNLTNRMPKTCAVLQVAPLLRELIVETVRRGELRANREDHAMTQVLLAELHTASPMPTQLTLPKDPRALALAQALIANPGSRRPLRTWCKENGVSVRTLERIFRRDVGMDFETWRRQLRLMNAVERLVAGASVKQVAYAVGYRQPSAFVATFRRSFGLTPKAWTAALAAGNHQ